MDDIGNMEQTRYVIVEDDAYYLATEMCDLYDIFITRTPMLESATFLTLDGARTVVAELTGREHSKYHYHMSRDVSPLGELSIVEVKLSATGKIE